MRSRLSMKGSLGGRSNKKWDLILGRSRTRAVIRQIPMMRTDSSALTCPIQQLNHNGMIDIPVLPETALGASCKSSGEGRLSCMPGQPTSAQPWVRRSDRGGWMIGRRQEHIGKLHTRRRGKPIRACEFRGKYVRTSSLGMVIGIL